MCSRVCDNCPLRREARIILTTCEIWMRGGGGRGGLVNIEMSNIKRSVCAILASQLTTREKIIYLIPPLPFALNLGITLHLYLYPKLLHLFILNCPRAWRVCENNVARIDARARHKNNRDWGACVCVCVSVNLHHHAKYTTHGRVKATNFQASKKKTTTKKNGIFLFGCRKFQRALGKCVVV